MLCGALPGAFRVQSNIKVPSGLIEAGAAESSKGTTLTEPAFGCEYEICEAAQIYGRGEMNSVSFVSAQM